MIREWSWLAPRTWPSSNCSRPRTSAPSRRLSQYAAPLPIPPRPITATAYSRRIGSAIRARGVEHDPAAELDRAVAGEPGRQARAPALEDLQVAPQAAGDQDGCRPGRLVLGNADEAGEVAAADHARRAIDPGPGVPRRLVRRRSAQGLDVGRAGQLGQGDRMDPFGPCPDPAHVVLRPGGHLPGDQPELVHRPPDVGQQPGRADARMAGEGQLAARGVDPDSPRRGILDEDGLAEAKLRRDPLAVVRIDRAALDEDTQGIAECAIRVDEHA